MTESIIKSSSYEAVQRDFFINVYKWMSLGLFLTAVIAYIVASSAGLTQMILGNRIVFYGLIISELIMVGYFSARINKISASTAMLLFLGYSALNGLTLSVIFLVYTAASIASTFFVTSGTFAAMSIYGYLTKKNLSSIGNICFMALIGLIIASLVNMFMHSNALYQIISYAGVLIFVGLTAYDTQKIKELANPSNVGTDVDVKNSINGALRLYLDFINLFLMLLRLLGQRK